MKNEEQSPQFDNVSLEPTASSLTPYFHYRHEETANETEKLREKWTYISFQVKGLYWQQQLMK